MEFLCSKPFNSFPSHSAHKPDQAPITSLSHLFPFSLSLACLTRSMNEWIMGSASECQGQHSPWAEACEGEETPGGPRGSSWPRDQTWVSITAGRFLYCLSHQGSPITPEVSNFIIPISPIRKLRHRKGKWLAEVIGDSQNLIVSH